LIIDADAVLPFAVPFQGFEPITGRRRQIEQNVRRVQLVQFAPGHRLDIHKPRYSVALVQCLRIFALKRLDRHDPYTISKYDIDASQVWGAAWSSAARGSVAIDVALLLLPQDRVVARKQQPQCGQNDQVGSRSSLRENLMRLQCVRAT
jgi:hypothetical protein